MNQNLMELCKKLEHYETPLWAALAILEKETMPHDVVDPCTGTGVLAGALKVHGYSVVTFDVHEWGYPLDFKMDWLETGGTVDCVGVMMNPPFSKATEFVQHAINLNFQKILCFQRFAWWESRKRKEFWEKNPPSRVYICGDRAPCWRHDIQESQRKSSTPTAHAWFVWDKESPKITELKHIWKTD